MPRPGGGRCSTACVFPFRNYVPTKGLPVGPGWIPIPDHHPIFTKVMAEAGVETAYCTDNPFLIGPRFGNFRRTLDEVKPSYSQGAYRFLNKPFKRPATRSTIERYLLPELSDTVEVGRLRSMAGWNSIYRDSENATHGARGAVGAAPAGRPQGHRQAVLPGHRRLRSARALDAPRVYQTRWGDEPLGSEKQASSRSSPSRRRTVGDRLDVDDATIGASGSCTRRDRVMDEWVGRFMNELDRQKLMDNG